MQRLTFHRYLESYVKRLSEQNTTSIYKLVKEVPTNLRLREPLFLYALCHDKVDILLKASAGCSVCSEYIELAGKYKWSDLLKLLEDNDTRLNSLYHKVYRSYVSRRDTYKRGNSRRHLLYKKTRKLQESKGISNYRLYTDLKLNQSNVNRYLKYGDIAKVSEKVADTMVAYLEEVK